MPFYRLLIIAALGFAIAEIAVAVDQTPKNRSRTNTRELKFRTIINGWKTMPTRL
jgi:hypothetical protein